mmetsp:Transcript_12617/g.26087  ORF Transcript_12617/g.26087 Transcript_12617/m.26087 type:complete len:117 (+) Transcript_12617:2750-3100(+)
MIPPSSPESPHQQKKQVVNGDKFMSAVSSAFREVVSCHNIQDAKEMFASTPMHQEREVAPSTVPPLRRSNDSERRPGTPPVLLKDSHSLYIEDAFVYSSKPSFLLPRTRKQTQSYY